MGNNFIYSFYGLYVSLTLKRIWSNHCCDSVSHLRFSQNRLIITPLLGNMFYDITDYKYVLYCVLGSQITMVVARKLNVARITTESELCLGYNSLKEKYMETIYIFLKGNDKILRSITLCLCSVRNTRLMGLPVIHV